MNDFPPSYRVCLAPMMKKTDSPFRQLIRIFSRKSLLYTEMIPAGAVVRGDAIRFLHYRPIEKPLAVQFGGNDPHMLAEAAKRAEDMGYDEINLNIGCPSSRVKNGNFGACLMASPHLVADCVAHIRKCVSVPVTVKTRIGIDNQDDYEFLHNFVSRISEVGTKRFVIHARKAILAGISPKKNRSVPPLRYDRLDKLVSDFPNLCFVANGEINTGEKIRSMLKNYDGVMIGRAVMDNPEFFAEADDWIEGRLSKGREMHLEDSRIFEQAHELALKTVEISRYDSASLNRHFLGLFRGRGNSRKYRQHLTQLNMREPENPNNLKIALDTAALLKEPNFA